jgi:hypothetical protein
MLLLRLRSLEEKNPVLDQVSSAPPEASLVSLDHTEKEIQTSLSSIAEPSLDASPKEYLAEPDDHETTEEYLTEPDDLENTEEYLESPEEDEAEVLEIGDRIIEILSGVKGVVVGFRDGRVVFDCREFGRCSRPAIMLQKI